MRKQYAERVEGYKQELAELKKLDSTPELSTRLERISMAGHMSNLENPEQFNEAVVEFVNRVWNTPAAIRSTAVGWSSR